MKKQMDRELQILKWVLIGVSMFVVLGCSSTAKFTVNLKSSDVSVRREAIIKLGQMGPQAQKASDELIAIAVKDQDPEVRRLAVESIGYIKPQLSVELVDAMVLCMNDEDVHIRRAAIIAVGNFDNVPPNFVTMLQKRLGDNDRLVRELATSVFERIGKLGVRALVRALSDPNMEMRLNAAIILGKLDENAQMALTDLKKVELTDESEEVRKAAAQAVIYITKYLNIDSSAIATSPDSGKTIVADTTASKDTTTLEKSKTDTAHAFDRADTTGMLENSDSASVTQGLDSIAPAVKTPDSKDAIKKSKTTATAKRSKTTSKKSRSSASAQKPDSTAHTTQKPDSTTAIIK